MCGKGSQTTTQNTSQTSAPNPQAMSVYQNLLSRAQGVANTPYQPYTSELVAPVNQQQGYGISNINAYQPAFQTGLGMAYSAAQPITAAQIAQYQSPYTQNVINATQAEFNNQNAQQQQALLGNAVAQGALGGNRVGVAQAELANQQGLAQAPVIANLENQGYMTGLNTALTEQQALAQGAYGVANMAQAGLGGANAQIGAGTLQQQTQQAQDTAAYQQYLNQLGYPFQTTQWLAGIGTGVGSQMGGTNVGTGTTTGPAPSAFGQISGALTSGVGLLGASGAFGAGGWMLPALAALSRGGVAEYASGGGVADPDIPTVPESQHTLRAQQRQLVAGDRHVQMFPHGTPELPVPHGMKRVESHSGVFHYNPKHISEDKIHHYSRGGHEHVLLGLGPHSKHEIIHRLVNGEHPVAIVERNEHGHEVRAALGTHLTAREQHAHMSRTKSKHHTLHIEHPAKVLSERMIAHRQAGGAVSPSANYQLFGGGFGQPIMPYGGGSGFIPGVGLTYGHGAPGSSGVAPPSPQDFEKMMNPQGQQGGMTPAAMKSLAQMFQGLNGSDSLAGLSPPTSDDLSGVSAADMAAMSEGLNEGDPSSFITDSTSGEKWGGRVGVANYADGGTVEPMPMSLDQMADAFRRLSDAGMLDRGQAADFASSRLQRMGINPKPYTGQPAPYARGGVANRDVGGDVPDDTGPSDTIDPTIVSSPPLPTPRPDTTGVVAAPADTGVAPPAAPPSDQQYAGMRVGNDLLDRAAAATKRQESGGNYGNVTTTHNSRGQPQSALGAYGIMDFNLPLWSKEALGHEVSSDEFLKNPALQDAIYRYKMGNYISRFGVEGAGRAWLGGEGSLNAPMARDPLGTTVGSYGDRFASLVGGAPGVVPVNQQERLPANAEPTQETNAPPVGVANRGPNIDWSGESNLWPSLIAAGAGMMASRSPFAGVAVGEGLQAGEQTYYGLKHYQEQLGLSQEKIGLEAENLSKRLDIAEKQQQQTALYQKGELANKQAQLKILASQPKPYYNAATGMMDYTIETPDGDVVSLGSGKVIAGPHAGQTTTPGVQPQSSTPAAPGQQGLLQSAAYNPQKDGTWRAIDNQVQTGPYDYSTGQTPVIEKGMPVPDPKPVATKSTDTIKAQAEWYLKTGKYPPQARGNNPIAIMQNQFSSAVTNYGNALAASRGITPQELAEIWQTAPKVGQFILGAPGQQIVSLGTAMRHLETLKQYEKAWQEAKTGDTQPLNRIQALIATQWGSSAATNLTTVAQILGPEIVKAIGVAGAGSDDDRKMARNQFTTASSQEQVDGAIEATERLMRGQLIGKENQARAAGLSDDRLRKLIGPSEYDALQNLDKADTGGGTTTAPPAATPTERTYQGHVWRLKPGGNPRSQQDWFDTGPAAAPAAPSAGQQGI